LQVDDCFEREAMSAEIARWLNHATLDDRLSVEVVRAQAPARGSVTFRILRDDEPVVVRTLEKVDAPCPELRKAVALAIAIALESTLVEAKPREPTPAPPPPPPPAAPRPPAPKPLRGPSLGPFAAAFVGLMPEPTWGAGADLSVPVARWLALRASGLVSAQQSLEVGSGRGDLRLMAGRLDACFVRDPNVWRFRACAGGALGRLTADGHDYGESKSPRLLWGSADLRLDLRLAVSKNGGISLGLDGWVPVARPTLDVRDTRGQISSEARLPAAGAALGLGVDFEVR
jgi:hypothetical protein